MKYFQKRCKIQNLLNLFLVIAFVMGVLILAPVDATASTALLSDMIGESIIDQAGQIVPAFDGYHPMAGHPASPHDMSPVPSHPTMIPPGEPGSLLNDAPGQAWESEAAFVKWAEGHHRRQRPIDLIMALDEDQQAERYADPRIMAIPQFNEVWGSGWTPNTTITLTIGLNHWTRESSDWGWVQFWDLLVNIQPGTVVQMTDGTHTRTHTVTHLTVTEINQDLNTVSGTADSGSEIGVWACSMGVCDWVFTVADGEGAWHADFSGIVDFAPGAYLWAVEYDEEGNSTEIYRNVPNPNIDVYPINDQVSGNDWTPSTLITLTIGANQWTSLSNNHGWVYFSNLPIELLPGQLVEMTDGTYTRSHTVTNLIVTEVNQDLNIVTGTADAGSEIGVDACADSYCYWLDTIADATGRWSVNFSGIVDIAVGVYGWAREYDNAGNSTIIYWYIPDPYFQVYPLGDYIYGYRWSPNTTVTASVGGNVIGSGVSNKIGRIYISSETFDIKIGDLVVLTDGVYSRTHIVKNITLTSVDQSSNLINGTANALSEVRVSARVAGSWYYRYPIADGSGNWRADFTGLVDFVPGSYGFASQADNSGNSTHVYWNVPYPPNFHVYPLGDYVNGSNWTPNANVTLTIGENQWTTNSGSWGWVYFNVSPFDIQPGQLVHMTDGIHTSTHTVTNLRVTSVDPSTDKVCGTAEQGSEVEVGTWESYYYYVRFATADASGDWCADFSGFFDITTNSTGNASQFDNARNSTIVYWYVVDPVISVYPDWNVVFGSRWPANTDITLTINDTRESWTKRSSHWGDVYFELEDFDLQPGQLVEMRDQSGTYTQSHVVRHIAVTDIDTDLNTVSGTADINTQVRVFACTRYECFYKDTNSNGTGNWLANFTGIVDIGPGVSGWVDVYDENNNRTSISWRVDADHQIFLPLIIK